MATIDPTDPIFELLHFDDIQNKLHGGRLVRRDVFSEIRLTSRISQRSCAVVSKFTCTAFKLRSITTTLWGRLSATAFLCWFE